jgi:hypothetical protein
MGSERPEVGSPYVRVENDFQDNEQNICNFGKGGNFKPAP